MSKRDAEATAERAAKVAKIDDTMLKELNHVVAKIPHFWNTVIEHMGPEFVMGESGNILKYLKDIMLKEHVDAEGSCHFYFTFEENPYFQETVLEKTVKGGNKDGDVPPEATVPDITWKDDKEQKLDEEDMRPFFHWLLCGSSVPGDFGDIFRERVWERPLEVYKDSNFV